ncbi:Transmembrane protein [Trichostrongylus colubriformis]|uniref:Transmembrane protein n=1 Tax=Trichostrongylus colubriformis TaxID=6319 RepID=A0AAN8IT70_TRICO
MALGIGLVACAISSVFFGTMFVPIKKFDAGDGMFAQWVISSAVLMVGFAVFCLQGFPGFFPLAMLGGAFWAIGNATAIPIISRLGMTIGILIWNITNCLTGWAGGRFGLFGMKANPPASEILNYGGLVCVIIGGILFSRVKSETGGSKEAEVIPSKIKATAKYTAAGAETVRLTHDETPPEKEPDDVEEVTTRTGHDRSQRLMSVF